MPFCAPSCSCHATPHPAPGTPARAAATATATAGSGASRVEQRRPGVTIVRGTKRAAASVPSPATQSAPGISSSAEGAVAANAGTAANLLANASRRASEELASVSGSLSPR